MRSISTHIRHDPLASCACASTGARARAGTVAALGGEQAPVEKVIDPDPDL